MKEDVVSTAARRFRIIIAEEHCKACVLCISVCPKAVLKTTSKLNRKGFHYIEAAKPAACIGCAQCAIICPDAAIEVMEED